MAEYRKKLIEVALPLEAINDASAYDKMPGIGPHPKGMHHWWARLPLPTARAILFASLVDDPSEDPKWRNKSEEEQDKERERLFEIIRSIMQKKMHEKPEVFREAHEAIAQSCDGKLPTVLDPFTGGGSIPIEAQRLGLDAHGTDLNPVPVLITRVAIDILPRFANQSPVNPETRGNMLRNHNWNRALGMADDIRYYADRVLEQAKKKIGHLYPKGPNGEKVIAWIWARTVASPDPSTRRAMVPLVRSFWLCPKNGKEVFVRPIVDKENNTYHFEVNAGEPSSDFNPSKGTVVRSGGTCLISGSPIPFSHIRAEGKAGRLGCRLMAMVYDGGRRKGYLSPTKEHEIAANGIVIENHPITPIPENALGFRVQLYGMDEHWKLFSPRQLKALTTISDLISEMHASILQDSVAAGLPDDQLSLEEGGKGALAYAGAVTTLLAMALDRCADFNNSLCRWAPSNEKVMNLFGRQAIPMVWDFAEANILADSVGSWKTCSDYVAKCVEVTVIEFTRPGQARQLDAASAIRDVDNLVVSTDPPYYDNIGYADLSDFFYIWLRRTLGKIHPHLFATMMVPKSQELIASTYRFEGDAHKARDHFESGFRQAFTLLKEKLDRRFPITVYYAFKQEDEKVGGDNESITLTTGWETLLEALNSTGFQITATWPVRASQKWRMVSMGTNALASYIVLACRAKSGDAPLATRKQFISELRKKLPGDLRKLQRGGIAPVDLAQAMIGPGMAVFTRYTKVVESDGNPMSVRTALSLINQALDEILTEQEGEFDADTRWALAWFEQYGMDEGEFGQAETLSRAKNTAVNGLVDAGVVTARSGKVRLIPRDQMPEDWDPATDSRLTVWEATQHMIHALDRLGERGAADLLKKLGGLGEVARDLAYRLFSICERKGWANEALAYNSLVLAWPEITKLSRSATTPYKQPSLFDQEKS
jgi:putative DNA methylase